jgi:hypothetical protein
MTPREEEIKDLERKIAAQRAEQIRNYGEEYACITSEVLEWNKRLRALIIH